MLGDGRLTSHLKNSFERFGKFDTKFCVCFFTPAPLRKKKKTIMEPKKECFDVQVPAINFSRGKHQFKSDFCLSAVSKVNVMFSHTVFSTGSLMAILMYIHT